MKCEPSRGGSGKLNILIVEDSVSLRNLIVTLVQPLAESIYQSSGGAEAVAAYCSSRPDVVLMETWLRDMDGIEATKRIRAADPEAKVVIISDCDDRELRRRAAEAGAIHVVLQDSLIDLVRILESVKAKSTKSDAGDK